ncbi:MAG: hypothetical protein ACI9FN_002903 [Saprospiraceae bacterium]
MLLSGILVINLACEMNEGKEEINIYCQPDNDLFKLLNTNGFKCNLHDNIETALESTPKNGALLILAKKYPLAKTILPVNFYQIIKSKNLRVYLEFPDRIGLENTGEIKSTKKERFVVASDFFGEKLSPMSILDAGLYFYIDFPVQEAYLKGANVAGFQKAVYGLENTPNVPILFEDGNVLISTTKLSDFNKSRYSPLKAWQSTIHGILSHLSIEMTDGAVKWNPIVKPSYDAAVLLPENAYELAVERGAEWYRKGRFLIHPDWEKHWQSIDTLRLPVGPPMNLDLPSGDGSLGVMEGHYSYINYDGSQPYRYWLRGDCVAETAMTFAIANDINGDKQNGEIAKNLMDFLFNSDIFKTSNSKDPKMSSYGLIGWTATHPSRYYGDDNARILLGSILSSQMMGNNKWDTQILELILANFRTSGENGFRRNALNGSDIDKKTWQVLMQGQFENIAPHYESWLWANYLWLYDKTGYKPLLNKAKKAIEITMAGYPDKWIWTNGIQQERARMILPLAWLVRAEDSKQHRKWLNQICDELLKYQVESGALREELGEGSMGKYGAPKSNKDYGHSEAPIIHANGEHVADMLYTSNFAFFALNEAAQTTKNPKHIEAVNKLADFMVRIQSSSSGRADLDGCWFRAFDYENWEYYGSNADHGWGAWGTLTGWTQSFITTTLALRVQETSFWDITKDSKIGSNIETVWAQMLPEVEH